jgi:hypothetical protein
VSAKSLTFSIVARTRAPVGQRNRRRGATAECEVVTMMAMVIVLRRHQANTVISIIISVTIIITDARLVSRLTENVPLRSSLKKNRLTLHMHAPKMSKRQYREDAPCSARVCQPAPESSALLYSPMARSRSSN